MYPTLSTYSSELKLSIVIYNLIYQLTIYLDSFPIWYPTYSTEKLQTELIFSQPSLKELECLKVQFHECSSRGFNMFKRSDMHWFMAKFE